MFTQSFQKQEQVPIVMILQGPFFIFFKSATERAASPAVMHPMRTGQKMRMPSFQVL